jgi:(2Fe-2S) ferredoxin
MESLKSIDNFKALQERLIADRDLATPTIVIPAGTCGQACGANDLIRITKRELLARELTEKIHLRITGCHGFCEMEPSILIEPQETFYPNVDPNNMVKIIEAVARGKVLEDLPGNGLKRKTKYLSLRTKFGLSYPATRRSIPFAFITTLKLAVIPLWPRCLCREILHG